MPCRLSSADLIISTDQGRHGWQRAQIPPELGVGYADRMQLDDGLSLAWSHYAPRHDLLEESIVERDTHSLTITIALAGRSSYRGHDGSTFCFLAGHTTVTAFRSVRGERRYLANETVRQLRLIVDATLLRKYALENLLDGGEGAKSAHQLFFAASSSATTRLASTLAHLHTGCRTGTALDMQIAALSLLAEQARQLAPPAVAPTWRPKDEERILQARDILLQQFGRPLTVAYLCAAAGVNEFKLKRGFRELFGTSPHRMLTEIRMRKAWELLESGEHVSSTAYKVGFQHLSSFSAAFQRYYGRSPKSVVAPRQNNR